MKRIFLLSLLTFYNGSLFCQTINKTELTEQTRLEKEYLQKGEDHFFEKRFGTALQWLKKAIEINPDNATAHAYIGDILLTLGEYNDALKHYRVAAELMSNPSLEYFRMGQIYYLQNDRLDSEKFFEKALVSNPELAEAHFYIGLISYRNGRNRQETLSHLKLFREKRPNFIDIAGLDKAIALLEDPKADLDKSKDLLTIDPLRLFYRKDDQKSTQTTAEDKSDQTKTAQTTTEDKSDQTKTAQTTTEDKSDQTKTTTEDKSDQSKTTTEDKSISDGFLSLPNNTPLTQASVLWPTAPDKAIKIIDKAIVDNPKDANLYSLKCEIYYKSSPQQLQEALQSCNQASRLSPDFRNLQNQGRVEEAMKNSKSAYESYRQALDRKMEVDLAYHTIEIGDTLPNKQAETRAILERLLSRQPDHKAGLLLLMKRQQQENNRIGLQSTTERLQSLYPDDDQLLIEMATVLLSQPETKDQAIQLLRRYYHSKPDDVKAGLTLAGLYLQKEDEKQALQILGELYENFPTNYDIVRTILILFVRQNQNLDSAETMVTKYLNSTEPTEEERQNIIQILPESLQMKFQPTTQETTPNSEDQNLKNEKEKPNVQQNSPVQP